MTLYTDSTKVPVYEGKKYTAPDGTLYPSNYPKNEIPGLVIVTEVARPSDPALVVTGFTIDSANKQVWTTRSKTAEELAEEHERDLVNQEEETKQLLVETDLVALRCFKAGVQFPTEWINYVMALRERVGATVLSVAPTKPSYPEGT